MKLIKSLEMAMDAFLDELRKGLSKPIDNLGSKIKLRLTSLLADLVIDFYLIEFFQDIESPNKPRSIPITDENVYHYNSQINIHNHNTLTGRNRDMSTTQNNDFRNAKISGVAGRDMTGVTFNDYTTTSNLAEAAAEIQQLLQQLKQTNPSATQADQTAFLTAVIPPTKRQRFANALREGGKELLKELMDNMYLNVAIATMEGWQSAENTQPDNP